MRRIIRRAAILGIALSTGTLFLFNPSAYGDPFKLADRFDELSTSTAGATATNLLGFTISDGSTPLGSIKFQFCENDPLPDLPCTAPTGFDASSAVLSNQSGNIGFSVLNATSNTVVLTRTAANPTTTANTYQLDGIVNPSTVGTYYIRLYIYQTTDASGTETANGGVALSTASGLSLSATVPPFLEFCSGITISGHDCSTASGYYIDFGDFSPVHSSTGTSQFTAATNAPAGYNVTVHGTTLTSGNNIIAPLTTPTRSAGGINQFGINLRANTDPPVGSDSLNTPLGAATPTANYDSPNLFTYNDGDTVVSSPTVSDYQTFTVTYLTNISESQPDGVYATTLTYICLANF